MLEQYKTIHTLLDIPYLQLPHPTVRHPCYHANSVILPEDIRCSFLNPLVSAAHVGSGTNVVQQRRSHQLVNSVLLKVNTLTHCFLCHVYSLTVVLIKLKELSLGWTQSDSITSEVRTVAYRTCPQRNKNYRQTFVWGCCLLTPPREILVLIIYPQSKIN
jgi:hypothetical protein